jgi:hypothetical protein
MIMAVLAVTVMADVMMTMVVVVLVVRNGQGI